MTTKRKRSDYYERIQADPERAQPDDFEEYDSPGKFEGEPNIAQRLYAMEPDQDLGDTESFGWYGLFLDVETDEGTLSFVVREDSQGFYSIAEEGTHEEIQEAWDELEKQYADEYEALE